MTQMRTETPYPNSPRKREGDHLPRVRGRLTHNAPLAPLVWFKSGGAAEWLFEPADVDDLSEFLREFDTAVPVMAQINSAAVLTAAAIATA